MSEVLIISKPPALISIRPKISASRLTSSTSAMPACAPVKIAAPPEADTSSPPSFSVTSNSMMKLPLRMPMNTRPLALAKPRKSTVPVISSEKPGSIV